ncbi:glucosamine inositolphosphorylceramide transferase family protein [Flavisolibacter nicotianae]|uniref:glucosamine inositolphosphorylceramide transferase family protein n=1 Tax=Flavisolibacter nicotianae TaxID=2364882 RepID=UPI0013C42727|nr:hypothetical protein [Flavisolibacter nicotianae]
MGKVRIGLLVDSFQIPFWSYRLIENLNSSDFAEVVLVVKKKMTVPQRSFKEKVNDKLRYFLYEYYKRWEHKKCAASPDAFAARDLKELISGCPLMEVECIEKKFSDFVKEEDVARIAEYKVDVLIRLGFRILRGGILRAAKMGVWSYHHGDNFVKRGGPSGFWEFFNKEKEIGSILQILTEDLDSGDVLYRSWSTVYPTHNGTLNGFYWKTSRFIPRKLKELHDQGEERFLEKLKSENGHLSFYSNRLYTLPDSYTFFKILVGEFWHRLRYKIWSLFNHEQWILLYSFNNKPGPSTSIFRYKRLIPPADKFWADPCVIFDSGKYFVFLEEFLYAENKGHISVLEIDPKGNYSESKAVLKKSYHLSYPFVFPYEGNYYMIPESERSGNIELYKAKNFPYEWEFKMYLMEDVTAVDTTVLLKDDKVWMFTNIVEMEGGPFHDELFLFSADTLFTQEWKSHPCNPIVSDVKSARSAGKLFYHNNKLYRPSQDCSVRYGYATVINEVVTLSESEYKERKVSVIAPNWAQDIVATHTFTFEKDLSMIDALMQKRK